MDQKGRTVGVWADILQKQKLEVSDWGEWIVRWDVIEFILLMHATVIQDNKVTEDWWANTNSRAALQHQHPEHWWEPLWLWSVSDVSGILL